MQIASATEATRVALGIGARQHTARPPAVVWLPAALVGIAVAVPLAYLVIRTLGAGSDALDVLLRGRTLSILLRSAILVAVVTAASISLAVPLAWLTVRSDLPLRRAWSVLTVLPLVIPSYVGAFIVVVALGPRGMLQGLLAPLGVQRLPDIYGLPGALLTLAFLSFPYVLLTVRAALWRLDPSQEEAARSLGRSPWRVFWSVTLPQLRPAIAAGGLLVALYTLSDFGAVSLLRYETFTWAIYLQYDSAIDRTLAAALSLVLVVFAVSILIAEARARGRWTYYRSDAGAQRPWSPVPLGRWRWPALGFCTAVVLLALALPISVLGFWAVRGILAGEPLRLAWSAAANSISISAIAAVATVAAAIPVAILSVRYPRRLSTLIERASYIGFALPGIAVALALVFFAARYGGRVYQSHPLLVFAYLVLFLPAAVGAVRISLLQVNPRLEEAARSLGRKPWRVLTTITLPLAGPGILGGAGLVFLLVMKELPATLILSPLGFTTLATAVWSASSEAFFARAAVPALLLIIASAIIMALTFLRERRSIA